MWHAGSSDYAAVGSLQTVFPVGSVPDLAPDVCVTVSLVDDEILEPTQQFSILLTSPNANVSSTDEITVDITDGEGTNTVLYSYIEISTNENFMNCYIGNNL